MTIIIAAFVFAAWTLYRMFFTGNIIIEDLLIKPLIWILPIYLVNGFRDLGFSKQRLFKNILTGLVVGVILSAERLFVNNYTLNFTYYAIVSAFFTAIIEEVFFRGYLLNRWLKSSNNHIYPLFLNGLFFTLTHIPVAIFVYHYSGYGLFTYLLINFVSGFVNVYLFYITKSVIPSITNHFVWNLFSGIFK